MYFLVMLELPAVHPAASFLQLFPVKKFLFPKCFLNFRDAVCINASLVWNNLVAALQTLAVILCFVVLYLGQRVEWPAAVSIWCL